MKKNILQEIRFYLKQAEINENSFLKIYSSENSNIDLPDIQNPYLYLILEGKIQFPDMKEFQAGDYFISAIDSPKTVKVLVKPFSALSLEFTNDEVIGVMLEIDGGFTPKNHDEEILDGMLKLIKLRKDANKFLFKHIKREIIFNLITGLNGGEFIERVVKFQDSEEIYKINTWIKENFKTDFTVEDLAAKTNMSVSGFHQKFKNAVGMGPIQCQKKLRLLEARRLMLDENKNVTDAAIDVGYESVSQFVRDYKKIFGLSPKEDILKIKNCAKNL